jgi:hypothetical protein
MSAYFDDIFVFRDTFQELYVALKVLLMAATEATEPVLYGIVSSYEKFLAGFTRHNENFWGSPLYENGAHMVSLRQKIG